MTITERVSELSDEALLESLPDLGRSANLAIVALIDRLTELEKRSPQGRGAVSLSRREGFSSSTQLAAALTGFHPAVLARWVRVGEAIREDERFDGSTAPARYRLLAAALRSGSVSVDAADVVISALGKLRGVASLRHMDEAEAALVALAAKHPVPELCVLAARIVDALDPDGAEPRDTQQRRKRSLTWRTRRDGMTLLEWLMEPEVAAEVRGSIESVARQMDSAAQPEAASTRFAADPDINSAGVDPVVEDCVVEGAFFDARGRIVGPMAVFWAQKRADAAAEIFRHAARCRSTSDGVPAQQLLVRVSLSDLRAGTGVAQLDGGGTISIGTVRRIAARAGIIPVVLGTDSEVLDVGRQARLFTRAQRLALQERDGGCAFPGCGLGVGWSDAHHIRWWDRDAGPTDIDNGVMLCVSHHHRVHDQGWRIEVRPPTEDPTGPPVPHFVAPIGAVAAHLIPGAEVAWDGRVSLRGGKTGQLRTG